MSYSIRLPSRRVAQIAATPIKRQRDRERAARVSA
jgi:hypothetical protein